MKTILHLGLGGDQFWRKNAGQWLPVDPPKTGSVWVVSDLAEEILTEIQVPRLFGSDRSGFIGRQLTSRFPDTPYKTSLPGPAQGGLLDRLAPRQQTLLAVDARQRVDAALDRVGTKIAGMWTTSGLLAGLGLSRSLSADLFIVLLGEQSSRILFVHQGAPVISRLIREASTAESVSSEITRTLRHLENTKVVERDSAKLPVLVLGQDPRIAEALLAMGMAAVPVPKAMRGMGSGDFKFVLFELALKSPPGQLAPLSRRTGHVAAGLSRLSYAASAASAGLVCWALFGAYAQLRLDGVDLQQNRGASAQLGQQLTGLDKELAAYPVPVGLVKSALRLERDEILSAPSMPRQLQALATVLAVNPAVRLSRLSWAVESAQTPPCAANTQAGLTPAPAPAANSDALPVLPGSRISFDLQLPPGMDVRARTALLGDLAQGFTGLAGLTLLQNPALTQAPESISGGSKEQPTEPSAYSWCLRFANLAAMAEKPGLGKP